MASHRSASNRKATKKNVAGMRMDAAKEALAAQAKAAEAKADKTENAEEAEAAETVEVAEAEPSTKPLSDEIEEVPAVQESVVQEPAPQEAPEDIEEANMSEEAEEPKAEPAPLEFSEVPPVLIVAAECAPLAKTGGLADVVGALPKYLQSLGIDARVILPFHSSIKAKYRMQTTHLFDYWAGTQWSDRFVGVDKLELDGVTYYFVDNEYYFGGAIYSGDHFEGEQYAFFVQAVCDIIPNLDFNPGIVHCNDWHTASIPFKLKARAAREHNPWPLRSLLTIHNLAFQGTYGKEMDNLLRGPDERAYSWDLNFTNMMYAGLCTADRVNTVSPTYAWEITTPEFGEGLQNMLAYLRDDGRLSGILNGIDTETWNPKTDKCLPANYELESLQGKRTCKEELLRELGLDVDMKAPLIAMVGRLTPQKGVGLACDVIESLVNEGAMFVVLGSGYPDYEWRLRDIENRHKGRVCSYIGYNGDLSHRVYAASDFFFMPSAFEPCGISQMIAMRYGSLPIVHEVGGLKDTVVPYNQFDNSGTGFSFARFDFWDAIEACKRALSVFNDEDIMRRLIHNAMEADFGFDRCARSYAELYRNMVS